MVCSVSARFILFQAERPTSNLRRLALPTPYFLMLVVGFTSGREREELPSLLCMVGPKDYCWDHASSPKVLKEETPSAKPIYT
jgi:hypothetical protein